MLSVLCDRLAFALPHGAVARLSRSICTRIEPRRYTRFLAGLARTPTTSAVGLEQLNPAVAAAQLATALGPAFARGVAAEIDALTLPRHR